QYGILDVAEDMGSLVSAKGIVEKPSVDEAPSRLAVIGRYILTPSVLNNLSRIRRGAGGEIQLTDAIAKENSEKGNLYGFRFRGQRFDCGSKAGFLQATVAFALARPDLRDEFGMFLRDITSVAQAAE
ncbi:MAG: UTP--glucose-1-phosphate uridylyltransferase, partial [Alphaproteobacteria bacterium]